MSKLYKLYLRAILNDLPAHLNKATLSMLTAINIARRDQVNAQPFNLLTRAEFYAELKRLTAAATATPAASAKIAPIVLTGLYEHTDKIALIKMLREIARYGDFNDGLPPCKAIVDGLAAGKPFTFNVKTAEQRNFCLDSLCAAGAVVVR